MNEYPKKKYLDLDKDQKDLEYSVKIYTNLTHLQLNKKEIAGVYLYGCDLESEDKASEDFNPVNVMRKARKIKCFQEEIKKYVPDYYISGLILMGKPKDEKIKKFKFYLKIKENEGDITGEIFDHFPESSQIDSHDKLYKFKFKRQKLDLSEMSEETEAGEAQCVANYLNICLGKVLKKAGYTKDRTTRKILYYNKNEKARYLGKSYFLFFPALKAVCEAYEGGNYMKLLPKRILKTSFTYEEYFSQIKSQIQNFQESFEKFKELVINKKGIKRYDQGLIKIDDIVYEDPFSIYFEGKDSGKLSVGDYYKKKLDISFEKNKPILIAVRNIDKGGKLKGDDIIKIHIPCCFLHIIGNIDHAKINIKDLVQHPEEKFSEIMNIREIIEKKAITIQEEEKNNQNESKLHNYLGQKFDPVTLQGQIIKPPLIQFDQGKKVVVNNGSFDLTKTYPYSKIKELKKIDIYLIDLEDSQGEIIWDKLKQASKELGIVFKEEPMIYHLNNSNNSEQFEEYTYNYFKSCDSHYSDKNNETDFIFMFMDVNKKNSCHYKIFKSVINKFDWKIPTQVILYDDKKLRKGNLSQFTNILCQMWAKKGSELYICDFSFVPKTMVIAYSSMSLNSQEVLTSLSISIGTKLYEYMFYSKIDKKESNDQRISPSLESLLSEALKIIGKHLKKKVENIIVYRDAVNEKQQKFVKFGEVDSIKKAIKSANDQLEKKIFEETKWCLLLVSKINEVKMFWEGQNEGYHNSRIENIPVGTIVDRKITNKEKYDFYLNSAESRQGTCSSTHYTILHDDTELSAMQIYKLTYYLTFLSFNTTHSIRVPAPLYFVSRRNKFTSEVLKNEIINPKFRTLNISL